MSITKPPRAVANAKFGFYSHLTLYVLLNLMLFGINVIVTPPILWFVFPLIGWGVGLAVHGLIVFVLGGSHYEPTL